MMNSVEWKDIPGFEGYYQASSDGQIRRFGKGVLRPHTNSRNGYCYVSLSKHNHAVTRRVHVLIMTAFYPEGKKNGLTVNHIDGNKTNNKLSNLEWCTQSENQLHAVQHGLQKISGIKVIDLDTLKVYKTATEAARDVGGSRGELVRRVCDGERSHYRGHRFARLSDYRKNTIPEFSGKWMKGCAQKIWR